MAASQIRITPEQMRGRAGEVRNQGNIFEGVITSMQGIIDGLQTEWEGAASQAFADQFYRLRPAFEQMRQLVYDLNTQLLGTADAVEQLDRDIAAKFS